MNYRFLYFRLYLKIFKDLLFRSFEANFLCFRIVICGPLPLPSPILSSLCLSLSLFLSSTHSFSVLCLPVAWLLKKNGQSAFEKSPILGRSPKALPGYSLRGQRLKSPLSFNPFFTSTPITLRSHEPLCFSIIWKSKKIPCLVTFFSSIFLRRNEMKNWVPGLVHIIMC